MITCRSQRLGDSEIANRHIHTSILQLYCVRYEYCKIEIRLIKMSLDKDLEMTW